jgi:hypothetical protein
MNSAQVQSIADAFARRLAAFEGDNTARLNHAFQLCFARQPTAQEGQAIRSYWMSFIAKQTQGKTLTEEAKKQASGLALSAFCQSLMASAEFRYVN